MNAPLNPIGGTSVALVDQPLLYQHCRIDMPGGAVLGESAFRLQQFQGHDNVSDLFEYQLELRGDSDPLGTTIDFSQIIGRPITVGIACCQFLDKTLAHQAFVKALSGSDPGQTFSIFSGMVASFAIDIPGVYRITMRPAAWRMTLTNRYRILRQMCVRDALSFLCNEHNVTASFEGIEGPDSLAVTRIQDWFQAGETDFEFMRRLMSKAHIFYYFVHSANDHVMVFANRPDYPATQPDNQPMRYTFTGEDELGMHQSDVISQYSYQQSMGISGVNCQFVLQTEAWDVDQPSQPLATFVRHPSFNQTDAGDLPFNQYKIYQYGCSDNEAKHFGLASEHAMNTANLQLSGASYSPFFRAGHRFHMISTELGVRPELDGKEFVLTQVQHTSSLDGEYQNQFSATVAAGLLSAVTIQDTQQGVVLAHVTTAGGDETVKDWPYYVPDDFELGRQMLTDSQGVQRQLNAKGVYVRFSTDTKSVPPVWVKLASHMQTIPEVGTSVWVSRANDESELPEIQNMVQADGSKVIVDSGWTAHSQVGNNYSTSYGDGKSVRFGQPWSRGDTDTAVQIVETAYARGLFRDSSYSRGGGYSYSTSEQHADGMLNESWSFGSNYSNSWAKESKSFGATGRSYHESVTGKYDDGQQSTESSDADAMAAVSASVSTVYGDSYSKSTSNGDTKSVSTFNGKVTSNTTHNGNVSNTTTINADSDNTSTITGTSTNTNTHNIVHNFTAIGAQSSSSAIGANNSNDVVGITNNNSLTGVRNANSLLGVAIDATLQGSVNNLSLTGMSNSIGITGSNNSINVTGAQVSVNATGLHAGVNVTGVSGTVNVTGVSASVDILGVGLSLSVKAATASIEISGPSIQIPIIVMVM